MFEVSFLHKKIYSNFHNKKIHKIKLLNIFINHCANKSFITIFIFI